jgi:hypothetical protein
VRCTVWAEAAKWLNKFDEAVLTVLDTDGYPASVRVDPATYDAATGELRAILPDALNAAEGPANLMAHYHDEKMWNIKNTTVKGQLVMRDGAWMFVSTGFDAPSKLAMLLFVKSARASGQKYLDKRGLQRPQVKWAPIKEITARVKG